MIIDDSFSAKTDKILSPNKIYILREKTASEGYLLDKTEYRFKIDRDNLDIEMDVYEDVIEKTVNIYKVFADGSTTILKGEPNVSFEIYLKSTGEYYKTIKTDEKGFVSVKLPYGKWIFKQVSSTSGFEKVKDFEIVINNDSDEDITKIISNAEIRAKLKLIKVDSESRKILVRDGIKFRIKNLDTGEYVCQNVTYPGQEKICVFETKDGMFITPYVLGHGNYQIEELEEKKKVLTSSSQENERYVIQISELESQINDLKNEKRRLKYFIKKTKKSKENKEDDYSSIFKTYLSITKDKTYDKELERDNLRQWLNLTNQNFTDKLIKHYPVLSKSNQLMDVCCLTALNLSIEDIATLLGIGERTVERYTSDICKKVGLPKGGKHIFVEFINSIKELEA